MGRPIYFDNAATSSLHPEVRLEVGKLMKTYGGNPSSVHQTGRTSRNVIEKARKYVASTLKVSSSEIFFTSGASEANNFFLWNAYLNLGIKRFITTRIEHSSVFNFLTSIENKVEVEYLPVDSCGNIDLHELENQLKTQKKKTMVCLMHINNEIGTILDIFSIGKLCEKYAVLFMSDMVQTVGHFDIDLSKIYIDFCSSSAHKFHGLCGCGFMFINERNQLKPQIFGGEQERKMRSGTENTIGIFSLHRALEYALISLEDDMKKIKSMKNRLVNLLKENLDEVSFAGSDSESSLYSILNIGIPLDKKLEMLVQRLDLEGFCVSGGSACSSGVAKQSRVANEVYFGIPTKTLRISLSKFNTIEEIEEFGYILPKILKSSFLNVKS